MNEFPPRQRGTDLLQVLGVFALLGPPIGALTFFAGIGVYGVIETNRLADLMWIILFSLIYAVPLCYLKGTIPALIAGLILGALAVFHRTPGHLASTATGLLVGMGMGMVNSVGRPVESASEYVRALLLVVTCIVATVLCWAVARRTLSTSSTGPAG